MKGNKKIQKLAKEVFPTMEEYPINSMTPSLGKDEEGNPIVSFLIIGDDVMLEAFRADTKGECEVEITTFLEKNENRIGQDLVIRVDFYYPTGHPFYEAVIAGDLLDGQKAFVKALEQVDKFNIWIANKDKVVEKVLNIAWDYSKAKDTLEELGAV